VQDLDLRPVLEQIGPRLAAIEEREVVAVRRGHLHDLRPQETRAAEDQDALRGRRGGRGAFVLRGRERCQRSERQGQDCDSGERHASGSGTVAS
jgi:hypothetical protein